jgi:hypothetical protein
LRYISSIPSFLRAVVLNLFKGFSCIY